MTVLNATNEAQSKLAAQIEMVRFRYQGDQVSLGPGDDMESQGLRPQAGKEGSSLHTSALEC